jgi:hypothetical protein
MSLRGKNMKREQGKGKLKEKQNDQEKFQLGFKIVK